MAKKKKPKRPRTQRRALERAMRKLGAQQEKLAALEPGGSRERPLDVTSASIVEHRARDLGCIRCDGETRAEAQDIVRVSERLVRCVRMVCARCGSQRSVWVRVVGASLN